MLLALCLRSATGSRNTRLRQITQDNMNPGIADFAVQQRLFTFFLENGCIPGTADYAVEARIAKTNPWARPVAAYGYDNSWVVFGGDLFEAETTCVMKGGHSEGMGQVASGGVNNLAYWSLKPRITTPMKLPPLPAHAPYSHNRTYISLVIGDGDSISENKGKHTLWMQERVARCTAANATDKTCFPLLWSMSPRLAQLAPDWLRWYVAQCVTTGHDWLVLPPSGDLYAYVAPFK